jgi:CheY-like chemotaxis protein
VRLFFASEILEDLGYNVLAAANGEKALVVYDENSTIMDLVVSDMVTPEK